MQNHNPYFSPDDESFPEHHPRRTFQHRQSGFINSDLLTEQSLLRKIYDADVLVHFVWECLGTPQPIYRWADPLGRNPYGVMEPTHYLPWHFDGNEFTVSILVQKADEGGVFEYVPNIRTPEAENYEHIQHILDGAATACTNSISNPAISSSSPDASRCTGSPESSATPPATSGSRPMCTTRTA